MIYEIIYYKDKKIERFEEKREKWELFNTKEDARAPQIIYHVKLCWYLK